MSILTTYKFLKTHELTRRHKLKALARFIKWQLRSRLNGKPIVHQFTDKTVLIVEPGMTGATGNVYAGLHDFMEMSFLLHFLRPSDLFVDVGANVGSYSVLAGGHVGAHVIAIEPVKSTFDKLVRNVKANEMNGAIPINKAVGDYQGEVLFNVSKVDTISRVAEQGDEGNVQVPIDTLDNILLGHDPTLIKIDVEGYERNVLAGACKTLQNPNLKAIIIETLENQLEIIHILQSNGFEPYGYQPETHVIYPYTKMEQNKIFIRDADFVEKRVRNAERFEILGRKI